VRERGKKGKDYGGRKDYGKVGERRRRKGRGDGPSRLICEWARGRWGGVRRVGKEEGRRLRPERRKGLRKGVVDGGAERRSRLI
jgi:hypothetical protein